MINAVWIGEEKTGMGSTSGIYSDISGHRSEFHCSSPASTQASLVQDKGLYGIYNLGVESQYLMLHGAKGIGCSQGIRTESK